MAGDAERAHRLIQEIYKQPFTKSQWNRILSKIQETLILESLCIIDFRLTDGYSKSSTYFGDNPKAMMQYDDYYCFVNPIREKATPSLSPNVVVIGSQVVDRSEWLQSEFFNDFIKPQNISDIAGPIVLMSPPWVTTLSMHRNKRIGTFTRDDVRMIEIITPHIGNRLALGKRFAAQERVRRSLEGILESLGAAYLVMDARRTVTYLNRSAKLLLSKRDGLKLSANSKLVAEHGGSAGELRRLIKDTLAIGRSEFLQAPGVARIERRSGRRPYMIYAFPGVPSDAENNDEPQITLLIKDPDDGAPSVGSFLQLRYGLTPAEVRLAMRLLEGKSPKEIATESKTSLNTVRSHIKSILSKTGTRRQSEFIALVYRNVTWMLK